MMESVVKQRRRARKRACKESKKVACPLFWIKDEKK